MSFQSTVLSPAAQKYYSEHQPPVKYRQPDQYDAYSPTRDVNDSLETVAYVPDTHIRIWYNVQTEGYALHHHSAFEVIYCIENGYTITAGHKTYSMNQGDIIILPPHIIHRLMGGVEGARFVMLFDPEPFNAYRDYKILSPVFTQPFVLKKSQYPDLYLQVSSDLKKAIDVYFEGGPIWEMIVYSSLMHGLASIGKNFFQENGAFSDADSSPSNRQTYNQFAGLLAYVDEHYAEDVTLEQAAEFVGFSKFHFSRLFKEYTGTTFYDHLLNRRIIAAEELLSNDLSMPITQICYQVGFHSPTSFSRSFKTITGLSPKEYRQSSEQYDQRRYSTMLRYYNKSES